MQFFAFLTVDPNCEEVLKGTKEVKWFMLNRQPHISVGCVFVNKPVVSHNLARRLGVNLYFFHRTRIPLVDWVEVGRAELYGEIEPEDLHLVRKDITCGRDRFDCILFLSKIIHTPDYTIKQASIDFPLMSKRFLAVLFLQ